MRRDIIRGVILVDLPSARMCAVRSCRYVEVECDFETAPGLLIDCPLANETSSSPWHLL
jgi:hypothetical protein